MIRVGVDVGGTFTDIVLERTRVAGEDDQQVVVTKVPSTPHDQSEGVVAGVLQVCKQAGVAPGEIDVLFHGTTVATNMVIERNGAEVGMLTTRGFRDILHMARHKRPHNFSLAVRCAMAVKAVGQTTQPPAHHRTSDRRRPARSRCHWTRARCARPPSF